MTLDEAGGENSPILVTGAHRSGTTWVGRMLAAGPQAAYISEPLNVLHRPGVMRAPVKYWYTYIHPENEAGYLSALQETLRFRFHTWAEIRSLRSLKDLLRLGRDWSIFQRGRFLHQRPLIKDPFAVFSASWFAQRLGCAVVITVRHPAAVASSLRRLGWAFDFADLLAQPLLMRDWLEPFRAAMKQCLADPADVIGQSSLIWRMIYSVVAQMKAQFPHFLVVRHEDLSLDPLEGYRQLYDQLGLAFPPRVQQAILRSSGERNPGEISRRTAHSVRLDSRANLQNWKRRLSPAEIERIHTLTADVAASYYDDDEWE